MGLAEGNNSYLSYLFLGALAQLVPEKNGTNLELGPGLVRISIIINFSLAVKITQQFQRRKDRHYLYVAF